MNKYKTTSFYNARLLEHHICYDDGNFIAARDVDLTPKFLQEIFITITLMILVLDSRVVSHDKGVSSLFLLSLFLNCF